MKNEFVLAFNEVLEEKQLPKDIIMDALQAAMISAYRRAVNASNAQHVDSFIDPETGKVEAVIHLQNQPRRGRRGCVETQAHAVNRVAHRRLRAQRASRGQRRTAAPPVLEGP